MKKALIAAVAALSAYAFVGPPAWAQEDRGRGGRAERQDRGDNPQRGGREGWRGGERRGDGGGAQRQWGNDNNDRPQIQDQAPRREPPREFLNRANPQSFQQRQDFQRQRGEDSVARGEVLRRNEVRRSDDALAGGPNEPRRFERPQGVPSRAPGQEGQRGEQRNWASDQGRNRDGANRDGGNRGREWNGERGEGDRNGTVWGPGRGNYAGNDRYDRGRNDDRSRNDDRNRDNWGRDDRGRDDRGRDDRQNWGRNDRGGDWDRNDGRQRDWRNDQNYRRYAHNHRDFDRPRYDHWRRVPHGHYFDDGYVRIIHGYYGSRYRSWGYSHWHRPYRRWSVGLILPSYLYWDPLPHDLYYQLPPAPYGCRYVLVDRDVLLIVISTGLILDAMLYY